MYIRGASLQISLESYDGLKPVCASRHPSQRHCAILHAYSVAQRGNLSRAVLGARDWKKTQLDTGSRWGPEKVEELNWLHATTGPLAR